MNTNVLDTWENSANTFLIKLTLKWLNDFLTTILKYLTQLTNKGKIKRNIAKVFLKYYLKLKK